MAAYQTPLLSLIDLEDERGDKLLHQGMETGRVFGAAPMTLSSLQKESEDRKNKFEKDQADIAFKKENTKAATARAGYYDKKASGTLPASATATVGGLKLDKAKLDAAVKAHVASGIANGDQLGTILAQGRERPDFGEIPDDTTIEGEYARQIEAARKLSHTELIADKKVENQAKATTVNSAKMGQTERRIAVAEREQTRREGNRPTSAKQEDDLSNMRYQASLLDKLNDYDGVVQTGLVPGLVQQVKAWAHKQNPDEKAFSQQLAMIVNEKISAFGGKAVTPQEMERILKEVPQGLDERETYRRAVKIMADSLQTQWDLKTKTLAEAGHGAIGGMKLRPDATPAPGGKVVMVTPSGKRVSIPVEKEKDFMAQVPGSKRE